MNEGRTVFAQLLDCLPKYEFNKCVARYHGNFRVRKLPAYEQFLVLAFAQLTWRESLRDIETCLASFGPKLYHAGIRHPTFRSTLADANEKRDWRIFADFAHVLIRQRTSLIGAFRQGKLVAPLAFQGCCNTEVVDVYFAQVLLPALPPGSVIVLDNASFHHSPTTLKLATNAGCHLLFLPADSPDLNPIEHFWATLKTRLRKDLPTATNPFLFYRQYAPMLLLTVIDS